MLTRHRKRDHRKRRVCQEVYHEVQKPTTSNSHQQHFLEGPTIAQVHRRCAPNKNGPIRQARFLERLTPAAQRNYIEDQRVGHLVQGYGELSPGYC